MTEPLIKARGLSKQFGKQTVLHGVDFDIGAGRIVGLIGPNGAGKTTTLKAIMGLIGYQGELDVLGHNPRKDRAKLMRELCFIADVAVLPRWLRVDRALDFMDAVHPRFDRPKTEAFLKRTSISHSKTIGQLSKGMVTQLHLAIVMGIDAKLLVLDEPTLGLDIVYRQTFYEQLINDYFDEHRTILVTTHQVEEIEHILSDVMFIKDGNIVLDNTMEEIDQRYTELAVSAQHREQAQQLGPIFSREMLGMQTMVFENQDRQQLQELGEIRTPRLTELYLAKMKGVQA